MRFININDPEANWSPERLAGSLPCLGGRRIIGASEEVQYLWMIQCQDAFSRMLQALRFSMATAHTAAKKSNDAVGVMKAYRQGSEFCH